MRCCHGVYGGCEACNAWFAKFMGKPRPAREQIPAAEPVLKREISSRVAFLRAWMRDRHRASYAALRDAYRDSYGSFSGLADAMADLGYCLDASAGVIEVIRPLAVDGQRLREGA